MISLRHAMAGLSDAGRMRPENEDCISTRPELGLAILADGMGGHLAGEIASSMAIEIITQHFESDGWQQAREVGTATDVVATAIRKANNAIHTAAKENADRHGMGATLVIAAFYDDRVCIGHVGDSRLYRMRGGTLEQLTQDHSVVQELINRGIFTQEEARQSLAKNLVTRALGVDATIEPEVAEERVEDGDIYLLCSDGLNDVLPDADIADIVRKHDKNLDAAARALVDNTNARGGPDNVSVILVRVSGEPLAPDELDEI
jgi:PPM family protein phosphatase